MNAPHILRALGEADTTLLVMACDHPGCMRIPDRAPRIVIPSRTPFEPGHRAIRVMTTLHGCLPHHREVFKLAEWLTPAAQARVEKVAREQRPGDFRPDFGKAHVEFMLVTTPEYRAFLADLGVRRVFTG